MMLTALLVVLGQVTVMDEGIQLGAARKLNCKGSGISCAVGGSTATINVSSGGPGGGAPTDAKYVTQTCHADLESEQCMSALESGLVLNTTSTGVQSIYAGTSCTNQFPRSFNRAGAATCASVNLATDVTGSLSGAAVTGAVATASALAADPADCSAGQYAHTVAASGALTCSQVTTAQLSGTIAISQGGTTETASTEDAVLVGASTTDWVPKVLPSCSNASTSKLLYDSSSNSFSCGTDQTGGGGSTTTIYAGNGSDTPIAIATTDPGVTLASKAITVAAGNTVTLEVEADLMNNSGATKTYTLRCRAASTTLVAVSDSTTLAAGTTRGTYLFRCRYFVRSTGATRVTGDLFRTPTTAANTSQTVAERRAWNTSASNWTGSQTFSLNVSSSATGATQDAIVNGWQLVHQAANP